MMVSRLAHILVGVSTIALTAVPSHAQSTIAPAPTATAAPAEDAAVAVGAGAIVL